MSAESLRIVIEYNKLPDTPEKAEIDRKYLSDEIGSLEFYSKAKRYLEKQSKSRGDLWN